jgi:hypothetical protein
VAEGPLTELARHAIANVADQRQSGQAANQNTEGVYVKLVAVDHIDATPPGPAPQPPGVPKDGPWPAAVRPWPRIGRVLDAVGR